MLTSPLPVFLGLLYIVAIAIAVIVGISAARIERNRSSISLTQAVGCANPQAPTPFSIITVADAFDGDTAILWNTQMPALELIRSADKDGVALENLRPMYRKSATAYPELYEGSSFETWIQFLEHAELVQQAGAVLVMSPAGLEFLRLPRSSAVHKSKEEMVRW